MLRWKVRETFAGLWRAGSHSRDGNKKRPACKTHAHAHNASEGQGEEIVPLIQFEVSCCCCGVVLCCALLCRVVILCCVATRWGAMRCEPRDARCPVPAGPNNMSERALVTSRAAFRLPSSSSADGPRLAVSAAHWQAGPSAPAPASRCAPRSPDIAIGPSRANIWRPSGRAPARAAKLIIIQ